MDTSETYIKMRLAAIPDLGRGIFPIDTTYTFDGDTLAMVDSQGNFFVFRDEDDQFCQLERQDQLQEMMNWSDYDLHFSQGTHSPDKTNLAIWEPAFFLQIDDDSDNLLVGQSMNQLWLAFVMKEKYNKVWDGGRWIT